MSFTHSQGRRKQRKKVGILERRRQLIQLVREHPDWQQQQLADVLGVNRSTVCHDLKEINEEFTIVNSEMWLLSRERVLSEIRENKQKCMDRLAACTKAHQGARWMEEWTKLMVQESKILGINSPSHIMVHQELTIRKEEIDAGINAALAQFEEPIIEIGKDGVIKLPETTVENSN
jgi:hypothetical protein